MYDGDEWYEDGEGCQDYDYCDYCIMYHPYMNAPCCKSVHYILEDGKPKLIHPEDTIFCLNCREVHRCDPSYCEEYNKWLADKGKPDDYTIMTIHTSIDDTLSFLDDESDDALMLPEPYFNVGKHFQGTSHNLARAVSAIPTNDKDNLEVKSGDNYYEYSPEGFSLHGRKIKICVATNNDTCSSEEPYHSKFRSRNSRTQTRTKLKISLSESKDASTKPSSNSELMDDLTNRTHSENLETKPLAVILNTRNQKKLIKSLKKCPIPLLAHTNSPSRILALHSLGISTLSTSMKCYGIIPNTILLTDLDAIASLGGITIKCSNLLNSCTTQILHSKLLNTILGKRISISEWGCAGPP